MSPDLARQRLNDLRNGLLRLHKTILDSEAARYDRDIKRITSRSQLFGLVLNDPWFAWLHDLSELIVLIDETLAAEQPATNDDSARLVTQARGLLLPAETGQGFSRQYFEALQRDPDIVVAHGEMMRIFSQLG